MNWNVIAMPAPEELVTGFVPAAEFRSPGSGTGAASEDALIRRYLLILFVTFGLIAGVQNALVDDNGSGERRLAEINLSERKIECRDCRPRDPKRMTP